MERRLEPLHEGHAVRARDDHRTRRMNGAGDCEVEALVASCGSRLNGNDAAARTGGFLLTCRIHVIEDVLSRSRRTRLGLVVEDADILAVTGKRFLFFDGAGNDRTVVLAYLDPP